MNITLLKPAFDKHASSLKEQGSASQKRGFQKILSDAEEWVHERVNSVRSQRDSQRLQLEFTDRSVSFNGVKEFEFALNSRTEFPVARVLKLIEFSPVDLEISAAKIRDVERAFAEVLARSVHHPDLIGEYFSEVDLTLFSHDHDWREVMQSLSRLDASFDDYKRIALVKYMQYLRARQTIMRDLFIEKTSDRDERPNSSIGDNSEASRDASHDSVLNETSLFDLPHVSATNQRRGDGQNHSRSRRPTDSYSDGGFCALPKGETVTLHLGQNREVELLLGGTRLRLYTGRDFYLVDDDNNTYPLHSGKNLVGRHAVCDVVLRPSCRAVSRNHLFIHPVSAQEIRLTDLSSHGTEVPAGVLNRNH